MTEDATEDRPNRSDRPTDSPDAFPPPTFHKLHGARGGGYSASDVYPKDTGDDISAVVVFAGVRQVFAPRITNVSAVDLYVRRPPARWPDLPTETRYPIDKADTVTIVKNGLELQLYCGTHDTDVPPDGEGKRDFSLEKDQIPNFFQPGD